MGGQGYSDLLITFKTTKMCSGSLSMCGSLSLITRFVCDLNALINIDKDNRGCIKR